MNKPLRFHIPKHLARIGHLARTNSEASSPAPSNPANTGPFELRIPKTHDVARERTMAGIAHVYDINDNLGEPVMRILSVRGVHQSASYLDERRFDLPFPYFEMFDRIFDTGRTPTWAPHSICLLGAGGYAYPKHLLAHHPEVDRIDVVEIDPEMTRLARRYFFLDDAIRQFDSGARHRMHLITADGRAFIEHPEEYLTIDAEPDHRYDAVLNDTFLGRKPAMSLATREAAHAIHAQLAGDGIYATNVVASCEGEASRLLRSIVATLRSEFAFVRVIAGSGDDPYDEDNNIVFASDAPLLFPDAYPIDPEDAAPLLTDAEYPSPWKRNGDKSITEYE
jgi:spermidine synthase